MVFQAKEGEGQRPSGVDLSGEKIGSRGQDVSTAGNWRSMSGSERGAGKVLWARCWYLSMWAGFQTSLLYLNSEGGVPQP